MSDREVYQNLWFFTFVTCTEKNLLVFPAESDYLLMSEIWTSNRPKFKGGKEETESF